MSTRPRDPLAASVASLSRRYWSGVLQTEQALHRDTMARRQAAALDEWRIDHLVWKSDVGGWTLDVGTLGRWNVGTFGAGRWTLDRTDVQTLDVRRLDNGRWSSND